MSAEPISRIKSDQFVIRRSGCRVERRGRYAEPFHLVEKSGALQTQFGGCPPRTTESPIGELACGKNLLADFVFEGRVGDSRPCWCTFFGRSRIKDTVCGKDDAACNIVLKLSNITWPIMRNDGMHGFFGDSLDSLAHGSGKLLYEVLHELRNVSFPFAERRQGNGEDIQPIVQILA